MMSWEDDNARFQAQAPLAVIGPRGGELAPYIPDDWEWSQEPPDDGTCRECYEWRRYPEGQRHFGMTWWRVCGQDCGCAHHANELWLAASTAR